MGVAVGVVEPWETVLLQKQNKRHLSLKQRNYNLPQKRSSAVNELRSFGTNKTRTAAAWHLQFQDEEVSEDAAVLLASSVLPLSLSIGLLLFLGVWLIGLSSSQ